MTAFDLRPLNLGEVLDRTFTLYRRHFPLFVGISAIPQTLVLALNVISLLLGAGVGPGLHWLGHRTHRGLRLGGSNRGRVGRTSFPKAPPFWL